MYVFCNRREAGEEWVVSDETILIGTWWNWCTVAPYDCTVHWMWQLMHCYTLRLHCALDVTTDALLHLTIALCAGCDNWCTVTPYDCTVHWMWQLMPCCTLRLHCALDVTTDELLHLTIALCTRSDNWCTVHDSPVCVQDVHPSAYKTFTRLRQCKVHSRNSFPDITVLLFHYMKYGK